jgi:hypothetical protein
VDLYFRFLRIFLHFFGLTILNSEFADFLNLKISC